MEREAREVKIELPKKIAERLNHSFEGIALLQKAAVDIYGVWLKYLKEPQTSETTKERVSVLESYLATLPSDITTKLEESDERGDSILTVIRDVAQEKATQYSRGIARHKRRMKAFERRGTPPDRIH